MFKWIIAVILTAFPSLLQVTNIFIHLMFLHSIDETSSEKELIKDSSISKNDVNLDLIAELASLKEKNDSMESELHEMQERYSEISLKFAEVEGERQKLVMTVRNLKIAMKS